MSAVYRNLGQLFNKQSLEELDLTAEWSSDAIEGVRIDLEELLEKREPLFQELIDSEEGFTALRNSYYWVSYVLRTLGFSYSVAELLPNSEGGAADRPDFTLFYSADEFRSAQPHRGQREFFAQVLAVLKVIPWNANLDEHAPAQAGPSNPAFDVDRFIRATGINWGILTNGVKWRLYHRETSGLFSTFYEADLIAALQSTDLDSFKYFWTIFSPEGLGGYDGNEPLVFRLLQ